MRYLLWDFDGTLARRDGGWTGALLEVIGRQFPHLAVTREQARQHLQSGFPWHTPDVPHTHLRTADQWWAAMEGVFTAAMTAVGVEAARAPEAARLVRGAYLRPDAFRLFDETAWALDTLTSRGWAHAILTNNVPELDVILQRLGITGWFARVFNSAQTGFEKPHPRAYGIAIEALGAANIRWMIGDSFEADVEGARQAGIEGILVRRPHERATRYCNDLRELTAWLKDKGG